MGAGWQSFREINYCERAARRLEEEATVKSDKRNQQRRAGDRREPGRSKARRGVSYERQAFAKLKPDFDHLVSQTAARMKAAAAEGRVLSPLSAAQEVVAVQTAVQTAQETAGAANKAGIAISETTGSADGAARQVQTTIGIAPPVITLVHYQHNSEIYVNGHKRRVGAETRDTVQLVLEMLEGTGAVKIAEQNLRHLDQQAGAY